MNDKDDPVLTARDPDPADQDPQPPEDAAELPAEEGEAIDETGEEERRRSPYRAPAWALARAAVVVVVSAVVYQAVVPSTHVIPTRMSRLVVSEPGLAGFKGAQAQSGVQQASQTGLKTLVAAAKKSPNKSGVYASEWAKSQTEGAAVFVYVLPSDAQATTVLPEVVAQQLTASSFSSDGLKRQATFVVSGIPGSTGALYVATGKTSSTPPLAVTAFRYGRVVAVDEVETSTATQANGAAVATSEYAHLKQAEPGFTQEVVRRPLLATILWAAGTAVLALLFAFGPIVRRRWAERRRRKEQEALSHLVVVGGHTISKHRR